MLNLRVNLRPKVTLVVAAVALAAMTLAVFLAYQAMRETVAAEYQRSADSVAHGLASAAEVPMAVGDKDELRRLGAFSLDSNALVRVTFTGRDDKELAHLDSTAPGAKGASDLIVGHADVQMLARNGEGLDVFGGEEQEQPPGKLGPTQKLGTVEVAMPSALIDARMGSLRAVFAKIVAGACLVIGAVMWFLAGTWTRRLDRLVDASERIARGQLDFPLTDHRADEVGRLTDAFGRMRVAVKDRDEAARRFSDTLQEQVRARTRELETAMIAAQEANRAKSDFLANMSHEIRTPMTAILGFAELLNDPGQAPAARLECVATINRSGRHLLTIINDILDISKIEAGRMTVDPIDCSPVAIISESVSLMRERAAERNLALTVVYKTPVPVTCTSDPMRLRQVLLNLLGNAVKFTEKGGVTVAVSADRTAQTLTIEVKDTGIGIAPENIGKLFKPFSQSDNSMSRRFGGTGLGLTIAKRFSEMLGGSLTVASERNVGSTFTVVVSTGPLDGVPFINGEFRENSAPIAAAAPTVRLEGCSILLAEDGVDNQRLLSLYLRKAGAQLQMVENGKLAVEAVAKARATRPFDLVLMDMQMPEVDGYTATRLIRGEGDPVPIVALTAHALVGDRERCLAAGCTDYLTKPVDRSLLIETCFKLWHAGQPKVKAAA